MSDHIDAIATGIESLGFNIGASYERRAKASFIEQALKLSGFQIAALTAPQAGSGEWAPVWILDCDPNCPGGMLFDHPHTCEFCGTVAAEYRRFPLPSLAGS